MIPRFVFLLLTCALAVAAERHSEWAQPIAAPGVPNFHKITGRLYRSAQPTPEGFREIERRGIKTVLNLRDNHSDDEEAAGTKLRLVRVKMHAWHIEDEDVAAALAAIRAAKGAPVLVHCQQGSDRTGVICAMYRMLDQGWSREAAIREMREGGYGFHPLWRNIIHYMEKVDIEKMRRRVDQIAKPSR